MLIETITFEIHNSAKGIHNEFLIENTIENQEKVFAHHFTRAIQFTKTFSFQFENEKNVPLEFIDFSSELENELDEIDEMVGVFA